jgi:hypothetical protein
MCRISATWRAERFFATGLRMSEDRGMTIERDRRPAPTEHAHQDRLWSTADSNQTQSPTTASATPNTVHTRWFVDYKTTLGSTTKLPDRMGEDQMVVDELRIRPDGQMPVLLAGGNKAMSGAVKLGEADIPKGKGEVTAAVRYAPQSAFEVKLTLTPSATAAERTLMDSIRREINELLRVRGDYDAIVGDMQAKHGSSFGSKTFGVAINPTGLAPRKQAFTRYTADGGVYDAPADSTFDVMIVPTATQDHVTQHTVGKEHNEGGGASGEIGVVSTSETTTSARVAKKVTIMRDWKAKVTENAQRHFQKIGKFVRDHAHTSTIENEDKTEWHLGIDPAKDGPKPAPSGDPKAPDKKDDDDSWLSRIAEEVSDVADWVVDKGAALGKKIPGIKQVLQFVGGVGDAVATRGSVKRLGSDSNKTSTVDSTSTKHERVITDDALQSIGTELAQSLTSAVESTLESAVAQKLGVTITANQKTNNSKNDKTTTTITGTTVTHEVGNPVVVVTKKA